MRRLLRAIVLFFGGTLGTIGVLLLWLVLIAVSAVAHANLPVTRRLLAGVVAEAASNAMVGDLVIGRLERVGWDAIIAREVDLFDADGRRVVHAQRLRLEPDWGGLRFEGLTLREVRFGRARLAKATALLVDQGDGLPTLIGSFDAPPDAAKGDGGPPLHVIVAGIEIANLTLEGELLGLQGLRAEEVRARGVLDIGEDVHVHIVRARGIVTEPFGFPGNVDHMSGTISTVPHEGVELRARARRGEEKVNVLVRYAEPSARVRSEGLLAIDVRAHQVTSETLRALHYDFVPELTAPMSGTMSLRGPVRDMVFASSIDTRAGHADLQGRVQDGVGAQVTVYTRDGLKVDQVWDGAPGVTARGLLRIDAPEAELYPRLHFEIEPLLYDRFAIPGFELDGELLDEGLRIDAMRARSKTATLDGSGTISKEGALDVRLHARFRNIGDDENLKRLVPSARGGLDADVTVRTTGLESDFLDARGRVALTHFQYEDIAAERLVLSGFVRGKASRPRAKLSVEGRALRVGSYVLGDPHLTLDGGPRVYKAKGQFDADGRRTFDLDATLTAEAKAFLIEAGSIEVAVGEGTWRGALAGLRLRDDGVIELGQLRLASKSQRLEAKGVIRMQGPDELDAQLQDFDVAVVRALIGEAFVLEKGRADATVMLRGDVLDPVLDVQGALRGGSVMGIPDVNALFLVRYAHGAIEADGEVDFGGHGIVQLRGEGNVDPSLRDPAMALRLGRYDFEMVSEDLDLALAPQLKQRGIRGRLGGTLRWKGSIDAPEASGEITLRELVLPGMSAIDVSFNGSYLDELLRINAAFSDERGPLLSVGGGLALDGAALRKGPDAILRRLAAGPWQLRGRSASRRLDSMPEPLRDAAPYPALLATSFDLARDATGTHGTVDLDLHWQDDLRGSSCASNSRPHVRVSGTLKDGKAALDVTPLVGPWRIGQFAVELAADVDRWLDSGKMEAPTLARASGRMDVQSFKRKPYLCEYGDGNFGADLNLESTPGKEPKLTVAVRGTLKPAAQAKAGSKAGAATRTVLQSCAKDPVKFDFGFDAHGPYASGSGNMSGCGGGATALSGRLPIEWASLHVLPWFDPTRDADVTLRFEEAQLKPLLERLPGVTQAEALARGELRVRGKLDHPELSGGVVVHSGRIFLVSTGQTFTNVNASLEARGNWIKIDKVTAHDGSGLEASGSTACLRSAPASPCAPSACRSSRKAWASARCRGRRRSTRCSARTACAARSPCTR